MFASQIFIRNNKTGMSELGTSEYPESQLSEPLPSRSKFQAEQSAMEMIERLIDRTIYRVEKAQRFRENLRQFSNMKTITNINEVNSLHFYDSKMSFSPLPSSNQPRALYVDSLLPISADIDRENSYKLSLSKLISSQVSNISRLKRSSPSKIQSKEKYLKLESEARDEEEDGFTKELRKMQEDRESKVRNDQKAKEQLAREERERLKEKKKEREERLSFDYSGLPIKIRNDSKTNLISKLINGSMNAKTQVEKEAFNDPNPQTVDSVVLGKKKNSLAAGLKKRDEVEFQQNRSLSEGVTVGAGVKYTYEGKTLEIKKKAVSTIELKKTINSRRLNKEQFERVKSLNGSSLELGEAEGDFRETKHQRSKSEAKLKKTSHKAVQKEKIIVNSKNLMEKMLERVNEMMERKEEENPETKYEYVGQIDIFNMNYLKNGHEAKNDKKLESLSTERSLMLLPKIGKTTTAGKQCLPKERQRIKEINTIIYEIRKKFDEKLKY